MPYVDIATLKASTDLVAIVKRDTTLRRKVANSDAEWFGPCPFCHTGDDRFLVWPAEGRWWCRVCQRSGDALTYVAEQLGLNLKIASDFRRGCELLGAADLLPARPRLAAPSQPRSEPSPADWQVRARQVVKLCESNLWNSGGERARQYLHGRGLTDETLRRWHTGYMPGGYTEWRTVAGLSVPCGILLPCEVGGVIWYLKVRRAKAEAGRKYPQVRGSRPGLFGADTLAGHDVAVMVEGEFDAMLLEQEVDDLVGVCTLGSATAGLDLATWGAYLLPVTYLFLIYDVDPAGRNGADKLAGETARARRLTLPCLAGAKDVTDFHLAGGNLRDWLTFELARHGMPQTNGVLIETHQAASATPICLQDTEAEEAFWVRILAGRNTGNLAPSPQADDAALPAAATDANGAGHTRAGVTAALSFDCGDDECSGVEVEELAIAETGWWHHGESPESPPPLDDGPSAAYWGWPPVAMRPIWDGAVVNIRDLSAFKARHNLQTVGGVLLPGELRPLLLVKETIHV